jgi:hypothetical protein
MNIMQFKKAFITVFLGLALVVGLSAQTSQTGSLRGVVTDTDGAALPGASVTVTGPALMGSETALTDQEGNYRIPVVPPGQDYVLLVEMSGFQTVRREGVIVRVGMAVTINFAMPMQTIEEELTVVAPSPAVDVVSTKTTASVTKETLTDVPMARSIYSALRVVPATTNRSIKGAARNNHSFQVDGVQANATDQNYGEAEISWETIEEMEVITGGTGVENFNSIGGMINVVTKSGGNEYHGQVQTYYTNESLSKSVIPEDKLQAVGAGVPESAVKEYDLAAVIGGPVIKDKLWFLANFRHDNIERNTAFVPTTINGTFYDTWIYKVKTYVGFGKLSFQPAKNLRGFGMLTYHDFDEPMQQSWQQRKTPEAQNHNSRYQITTSFNLTWVLNPDTFIEFRGGNWLQDWQGVFSDTANPQGPYFRDRYTGYEWGRLGANGYTLKKTIQGSAKITHFQDDFLGADHEIKAGLEYQTGTAHWGQWGGNGLSWDYYNGSPYYYRGLYGLDGPHPEYGDGRLTFNNATVEQGNKKDSDAEITNKNRFGLFVTDTISIGRKLSVNLGFRYDTIKATVPALTKNAAGSSLGRELSQTYIVPVYGTDPFAQFQFSEFADAFPYSYLTPSIGVSYDLFGNGKTALKASYGKYAEGLPTWFVSSPPVYLGSFQYRWWDDNGNGQPDSPGTDSYQYVPGWPAPSYMKDESWKEETNPDIKIPYEHQVMFGIDHELFTDFRVSLNYTYKTRRNELAWSYYDRAADDYWSYDASNWVPFQTTVPEYQDFPATAVTVYFLKADHPEEYTRRTNVPNDLLEGRYHSFELSFNKRMSQGWSLGGSFVYTDLKGNYEYSGGNVTSAFQTPNWNVNRYGDLRFSLPVMIKLYGSVVLPYQFNLSFFFEHLDGNGWGRTVTVEAPAAWRAANDIYQFGASNSVNVEVPGTRRNQSSQSFDLRLEKEFTFGKYGRLGVFMDMFNALGFHSFSAAVNPGGTWRPDDVNSGNGTFTASRTGFNTITGGVRTYKFSIRYTF